MKPKPDDPTEFDQIFKNYNREALAQLRKSGDSLPGCSLFFVGVFAVLVAISIFLFQIGFWLSNGHWLALPFSDLLSKIGVSVDKIARVVKWNGIVTLIRWIGEMSSALMAFLAGLLFIFFGRK